MTYLIANWKMNPVTLGDAQRLLDGVAEGLKGVNLTDKAVVICPPFPLLHSLISNFQEPNFQTFWGAQNCGYESKGAFTGEVSPAMLKDLGAEYVILGHSERRRLFQEDDEMIAKKVRAAFEAGLTPILCVGSPTQETDEAERQTINKQLDAVFASSENLQLKTKNLLIAYEPVWAIGTGNAATPKQATSTINFIRLLAKSYKLKAISYLYGGSVDSKNIASFTSQEGIDGALVGGASLDAKEFVGLLKKAQGNSKRKGQDAKLL